MVPKSRTKKGSRTSLEPFTVHYDTYFFVSAADQHSSSTMYTQVFRTTARILAEIQGGRILLASSVILVNCNQF